MKTTNLVLIAILAFSTTLFSQQIPLKGVVTVQNSKTNTGKVQYVKNAEITHPKAKSEVTDDDGKFTLYINGLQPNTQTQISVKPHGQYFDSFEKANIIPEKYKSDVEKIRKMLGE